MPQDGAIYIYIYTPVTWYLRQLLALFKIGCFVDHFFMVWDHWQKPLWAPGEHKKYHKGTT